MAASIMFQSTNFLRTSINPFKSISYRFLSNYTTKDIPEEVLKAREQDAPIDIANPFEKPKPQCVLCKYKITPNFKNVRLLSQFVSRFTGRIYGRHITALCPAKQKLVEREIYRARSAGLMPYYFKDPIYFNDPKLYDPEHPIKPHNH